MTPFPIPQAPADIRLWRLDLDLAAPLPEQALALLDATEHTRLDRFQRHEDQVRFALTRAALKRLLAGPASAASIRFDYTPTGRPVWRGGTTQFNVAHSGALALIVMSDQRPVGVDVELSKDVDVDALSSIVLTPDEQAALRTCTGQARRDAFYRYWVCKEAALKAAGQGIAEALQRIQVEADSEDAESGHTDSGGPGTRDAEARRVRSLDAATATAVLLESLKLRLLPMPAGYTGAVAWASGH